MKVLRVIASLDPRQGGPVEGLLRSAAALADWGHTTEVLCFDPPSAPYLADLPFPVHATGPVLGKFGFTPRLTPWMSANAHRFDVAVLHGLWNYAPIGAWLGLRGTSLPYVQVAHGMLDPWFNSVQPVKRWVKQALWLVAQGHVLSGAHSVLFTSEEERIRARTSFFGPRYTERVIAYGAADMPSEPRSQHAAFAACLPGLAGRPYLLFLGRLHPKKGCDMLVSAFCEIAQRVPDIDLVMAGPCDSGMGDSLEALAAEHGLSDRVHFPGLLQGHAKWGAYRGAEAFVLPSHQENFGIAVAEAMASGTPVLISDKVNIWREVESAAAGFVAPDTLEGTCELLDRFLSLTPSQSAAMGRNARLGYERHFGITEAAQDLLSALEDAIGAGTK